MLRPYSLPARDSIELTAQAEAFASYCAIEFYPASGMVAFARRRKPRELGEVKRI